MVKQASPSLEAKLAGSVQLKSVAATAGIELVAVTGAGTSSQNQGVFATVAQYLYNIAAEMKA